MSFLLLMTMGLACKGGIGERERYRVGILSGLDDLSPAAGAFIARMKELGYEEGRTIAYDVHRTNFEPAEEKRILSKFIQDQVDLIFTFPTEATISAKEATSGSNIPVVFAITNIEGMGLVESIHHPGGNVTGVRYPGPYIAAQRFEIMMEIAPKTRRILLPYQKDYPIVQPQLKVLKKMASKAKLHLVELPVEDPLDLERCLNEVEDADDLDFILVLAEPLAGIREALEILAEYGLKHNIPLGGAYFKTDNYRSIFGVDISPEASGRQAAEQAGKILSGIPVDSVSVVSPETVFKLDLIAAKQQEVRIPRGLIKRADTLIQ